LPPLSAECNKTKGVCESATLKSRRNGKHWEMAKELQVGVSRETNIQNPFSL
jgi:hypothetical protein